MRNFLMASLFAHILIIYFLYSSERVTLSLEPLSQVEVAVVEREKISTEPTNLENEGILANPSEKVQKAEAPEMPGKPEIKTTPTAAQGKPVAAPAALTVAPIQNISSQDLGIKVKYPRLSRMLSEEGRVIVLVQTDENGHIHKMSVSNSSGFARLDEAALESVSNSRTQYDKDSRIKISFLFKLK